MYSENLIKLGELVVDIMIAKFCMKDPRGGLLTITWPTVGLKNGGSKFDLKICYLRWKHDKPYNICGLFD